MDDTPNEFRPLTDDAAFLGPELSAVVNTDAEIVSLPATLGDDVPMKLTVAPEGRA